MATIVSRKRDDGSIAHMARIAIKRKGVIVHREAQTFDRKQAAYAWAEGREQELNAPGGLEKATSGTVTLADAIDKYVSTSLKEIGRTKAQVLRAIKTYDLASIECHKVQTSDIVAFAHELASNRQPQTVANYLSHLGAVFAIARPAWGYALDVNTVKEAMTVTKRLGTTSRSRKRDRRPTMDELNKLMGYFLGQSQRNPRYIPMHRVMAFALFSTRRQEEITRIAWTDLDEAHSRVLVRDMKNPGQKIGNDIWCDLPEAALNIIKAMPKTENSIFPYGTDAISARFTRACKFLEIQDLHFHDLRHEGVSRLFELGLSIPHAAAVSGHKSWQSLQRYTHIRYTGDRYENWSWLAIATNRSALITSRPRSICVSEAIV